MSIDASALNAIHNAISSSSAYPNTNRYQAQNDKDDLHTAAGLARAASQVTHTSRYQAQFQEKLNRANGSDDNVTLSEESLAKLEAYNRRGVSSAAADRDQNTAGDKDKTQSTESQKKTVYSYDYQTMKQKRLENQAKIEKEIALKYSKEQPEQSSTSQTAENKGGDTASLKADAQDKEQVNASSEQSSSQQSAPVENAKAQESAVAGTQKQTSEVDV